VLRAGVGGLLQRLSENRVIAGATRVAGPGGLASLTVAS
jgi:hypothetical protein